MALLEGDMDQGGGSKHWLCGSGGHTNTVGENRVFGIDIVTY